MRNFSAINKFEFTRKLAEAKWDHLFSLQDVDKAFGYFIKRIKRIYNKTFPYITTTNRNKNPPWLTNGLLKSIRYKNKLYIRMRSNDDLKPVYKNYRNHLTKLIKLAKERYYKHVLIKFKHNSSKLWSHLNSIIKNYDKKPIPIDPNTLNDYFASVFNQAPVSKDDSSTTIPSSISILESLFLTPVTYNELIITMNSLSNSKSVGSDGLNPIIIKSNFSFIANQLLYIFNLSFSKGIFPKLLKNAIVIPVFKSGSNTEPSNYRPISILSIFSKLLEKLFYNRLLAFINAKGILHSNQFGFRAHHSTNFAIAHVLSSLISKINANGSTVLILLDLKKAFDLIKHKLLLNKLSVYGVRGLPLLWLNSYLTNRTQITKVNNMFSNRKPISAGVPQGSILAPLLFILFINDVFQFNSINIEIFLYADDTAIIMNADNDELLQICIDKFLLQYCVWCNDNCIIINPSKSNCLAFNCTNVKISINNQ